MKIVKEPVPKRGTIGQRLVSRGAITVDQLERAIEAQVIFGGRIGTSLLELGFVDEKTLNAVLSEQHNVPALDEGVTDPMPSYETLQLIAPELVRDYRVLPFRREGKRLHVLMENPSNFRQLDDLAFRTGFIIIPYVAAEARVAFLLERYFGIRRESRHLQLTADGSEISRPSMYETPEVAAASTGLGETEWPYDEGRREMPLGKTKPPPEGEDLLPEDLHHEMMAAPIPATRSWEAPGAPAPKNDPEQAPPPGEESAAEAPALTAEEATVLLAGVEERDEVARTLLTFAMGRCRRAALFILQRGALLGWDAAGEGVHVETMRSLRFSADVPSVLEAACRARTHLVCPLADASGSAVHGPLLLALGGGAPEAALVIPISVNDRVVNVFYADNGEGGAPPEDLAGFLEVTAAVPLAFARLLRKRRSMVLTTE